MTQLNENVESQISRMKAMMNYGLKTESKPYSSVEYERLGADGKMYGIIREGSKYHIKVADKKKPLKEDYDYIGGFRNHKNFMFDSYANALKHFDMKMSSLNEAYNKRGSIDSWNVNGRDSILAEASDKMRLEIARQREIMNNSSIIAEGKKSGIDKSKASSLEKSNIRMSKPKTGTATGQGGDVFDKTPDKEFTDTQKDNIRGKQKPVLENVEDEFMDAPLSNVNVASNNSGEGAGQTNVMGGGANGSLGEEDKFEDDVDLTATDGEGDDFELSDTEVDDIDGDVDGDVEAFDSDEELEEFPDEDEEEFEDDSLTATNAGDEISEVKAELASMRSLIDAIAEKIGVTEFDKDEPLYPEDEESDEDEDTEEDVDIDVDADSDGDEEDVDVDIETEESDDEEDAEEDDEVFESRNYRQTMGRNTLVEKVINTVKRKLKALTETELHDFGKHPRFQKEPMTYPTPTMGKKEGQYEEGADEDNTDKPYATSIGDSEPFGDGESVKKISNAIAEEIKRRLSKNV